MAAKSKIQWTEMTWNPMVGCTVYSPGCTNCYAMSLAERITSMRADGSETNDHYVGTTRRVNGRAVWTGHINRSPLATLYSPTRRKKPTMWFVNSMSDLFHEKIPDRWIDEVFAVMAVTPWHTYQVLTKRSARMQAYLSDPATPKRIYDEVCDLVTELDLPVVLMLPGVDERHAPPGTRVHLGVWPIPNVWAGVSVEDMVRAGERLPDLLKIRAAVRFISAEPLLAALDLRRWLETRGIDWVIVGGESGGRARPMLVPWARAIVRQCRDTATACFVKQMGALCLDEEGLFDQWPTTVDHDAWNNDLIRLLLKGKGDDMRQWPMALRVRDWPDGHPSHRADGGLVI